MTLFTSPRERLYWTVAILALLIIYATLGLQPEVASLLRSLGLIELSYFAGFVLILITIPILGFVKGFHWSKIALAIGLFSMVSFAISRIGLAEERTHLIEYGFIGTLAYLAIDERNKHSPLSVNPVFLAIIIAGIAGVFDECFQYFIPGRVFDPRDILFNVLASSGSIVMIFLVQKLFSK